MKNYVQLLSIIFVLVLTSCSTYVERIPAQVDNELFNNAFSIPFIDKESGADNTTDFKNIYHYMNNSFKMELVPSKSLGKNIAFKFELDLDNKGNYVYRIFHAPNAFKDYNAFTFMKEYFDALKLHSDFNSPYAPFEAYYNAKEGDASALEVFYKVRAGISKDDKTEKASQAAAAKLAKAQDAQRAKAKAKRKSIIDALDAAPEAKQFRTFVAKNDRKGAAGVLRKYLPWEEMAPFETKFWENYLEVMENPVPLDQKILIYRGLGGDYVHRGFAKGKELSEKEAILSSNAFIMSPVLTKNQGSWNRRLRSLEAMNKKFIGTNDGKDEYTKAARITTMYTNHSGNPQGSPFLSLTPSYEVADGFGGGESRTAYFAVDPRVINFNYASGFEHEYEYLISVTTFPDELIAMTDGELMPEYIDDEKAKAFFEKNLQKRVSDEFGAAKAKDIITKMKKNSYQFFKGEFKDMKNPAGTDPAASNLKFFKKFAKETDVPVQLSPKGDMACKDLIQVFWMAK